MANVKSTKTEKATHPEYSEMVATAIETLTERGRFNYMDIVKFITSKYKLSDQPKVVFNRWKLVMRKGDESGALFSVEGPNTPGSSKLTKKAAENPKKTLKSPRVAENPVKAPDNNVAVNEPKISKSPPKVKTAKKLAKEPTYSEYSEMVANAIETLKERGAFNYVAVVNLCTSKYKLSDDPKVLLSHVKLALKKGVGSGAFFKVKRPGAAGCSPLVVKPKEKLKKAAQTINELLMKASESVEKTGKK